MSRVVLGVDPGTRSCGIVAIDGLTGTLLWYRRLTPPDILNKIFVNIVSSGAMIVGVEKPFAGVNVRSALLLGEILGVVKVAGAQCSAIVEELTPPQIKKAITGTGRAHKKQVCKIVHSLLQIPLEAGEDVLEAGAVALTIAHRYRVKLNK